MAVQRWLIIGIALLMLATLALLAKVISVNDKHEDELAGNLLDRALAIQNQRIRVITNTYAWKLQEEATRFGNGGRVSDSTLMARWEPIMQFRPAIRSISIVDDQGQAWMLDHLGNHWTYTITSKLGSGFVALIQDVEAGRLRSADTLQGQADPRTHIWFSRALESQGSMPVWTEANNGGQRLYLSQVIRGGAGNTALRVLGFQLDPETMLANETEWNPGVPGMVLNSNWEPMAITDTAHMGRAWMATIASRPPNPARPPVEFRSGNDTWYYQFKPLFFNGTTLYSGVAVGMGVFIPWEGSRHIGLWSILLLLLLLSVLLALVFIQSRSADRKARRQAHRSSQQARHLAQAIEQREVLDREVHHRVKNNLQVVSSLLSLQARSIPGEEARNEFLRGKRRIDSMALVHHKLYRQHDLSAIDLGLFLDDIAKAMAAMFEPDSRPVAHTVVANGIRCDADTSIQLGMVVCELLANCYQHAFPSPIGGHIMIKVERLETDLFKLTVKDNGQGFDPNAIKAHNLGLQVVEALAGQLEGGSTVSINGGTQVEMTFRAGQRL